MGEYKFRKNNFTQFHKNHIKLCKFCESQYFVNYMNFKYMLPAFPFPIPSSTLTKISNLTQTP